MRGTMGAAIVFDHHCVLDITGIDADLFINATSSPFSDTLA
ncbi:hypothetical protein [Bartonella australis]|nr:hypothetical protein [Bartonella australis]